MKFETAIAGNEQPHFSGVRPTTTHTYNVILRDAIAGRKLTEFRRTLVETRKSYRNTFEKVFAVLP